jgi:hypothetical protein
MDQSQDDLLMRILEGARDLTLATVRPDGYPQATTVSFAHDELALYVGIGKESQKAKNIRYTNKVSLAMQLPYDDWGEIRGLSMSAVAEILDAPDSVMAAQQCLLRRFPQVSKWVGPNMGREIALVRITPQVISLLDYSKGFGHTELLSLTP